MNADTRLKLLRRARFLQSAAQFNQCPEDAGREVAFVGRSNAGKSSVLNRVTDQGRLARTSRTPGRTQLLNFFALDEKRRLVDLPGYGFAKVQASLQKSWEAEMIHYLNGRNSLAGLVLVMDVRHPLQSLDRNFIQWADQARVPVRVLLNKADKLSKSQAKSVQLKAQAELASMGPMLTCQLFSATESLGVNELRLCLVDWLAYPDAGTDQPAVS